MDYYEKLRGSAEYKHISLMIFGVHFVMLFIVLGSIIYDTEKKDDDKDHTEGVEQAPPPDAGLDNS